MKFSSRAILALLLVLLLALVVGCSDDDDDNPTTPSGPDAEETIGVAGGTIEMEGEATLVIPASALTADVDFTMDDAGNNYAAMLPTRDICSTVVTIGPAGTQFDAPVLLTMHYAEEDLGGADESAIQIYTDSGAGWTALPTTVDEMANVATATIQHLSDFVLTTPVEVTTEDVFAVVEVMRNFIQVSGLEVMRSDAVSCRFDAVVGEEPSTPLQAGAASFGAWDMVWSSDSYEYVDAVNMEFLTLGEDYALVVTESDDVPALNVNVGLVEDEVYITNLAVGADAALSGFTLEWSGSSLGSTVEVLMTSPEAGGMSMTLPNTGSYTFTESDLATVTSGAGHILLSWEQEQPLVAEGFDGDSMVRQIFTGLCSVNFTEETTPTTVLYTETPNLSIPDATRGGPGTPVTDTISVSESGSLSGLRVYLNINHSYSSDLIMRLTSPEGTELRLFWIGEGGEPNTDPAGWYPDDFTPKDDFAGFYGEDINGTWTITAQDMSYDAPGSLLEWRMEFTYGQ